MIRTTSAHGRKRLWRRSGLLRFGAGIWFDLVLVDTKMDDPLFHSIDQVALDVRGISAAQQCKQRTAETHHESLQAAGVGIEAYVIHDAHLVAVAVQHQSP